MKIKKEIGITLVALVITIIILLILAGVTVGLATNGTGLFEKAKLATDEYNNKAQQEETELAKAANEINGYIDGNRDYQSEIKKLEDEINELKSLIGTVEEGKTVMEIVNSKGGSKNINLNYVTKSNNTQYLAETDGMVYLQTTGNGKNGYIEVYDSNNNFLYKNSNFTSAAIDQYMTLYVKSGCYWKAYGNGGTVQIRWFPIE